MPRLVECDPQMPLRNERHERFARLRAILTPKLQAAREAGFDVMTAKNAAKLDRREDIRARVAALCGMDEEIIRMKRDRVEERLNKAAYGDLLKEFARIENGNPVIDWQAVKDSELSVIISSFAFDKDTGQLLRFERDNAMNAAAQLRDMLGLRAPTKTAFTDTKGDGPGEIVVHSSHERARAVAAILAKAKAEAKAA